MSGGEYDVGYGKPPRHTRWEKGRSGNLKGRPIKRQATIAQKIEDGLKRKIKISENGVSRNSTIFEAILLHIVKGIAGRQRRRALRLLQRYEALAKSKPKLRIIRETSQASAERYRKLLEEY